MGLCGKHQAQHSVQTWFFPTFVQSPHSFTVDRPKVRRRSCNYGGLVAKLCLTLATPWTIACQAPLSMGFSRKEHRNSLPFTTPEDLPNPAIKPTFLTSPALAGGLFTTSATWEAQITGCRTLKGSFKKCWEQLFLTDHRIYPLWKEN